MIAVMRYVLIIFGSRNFTFELNETNRVVLVTMIYKAELNYIPLLESGEPKARMSG